MDTLIAAVCFAAICGTVIFAGISTDLRLKLARLQSQLPTALTALEEKINRPNLEKGVRATLIESYCTLMAELEEEQRIQAMITLIWIATEHRTVLRTIGQMRDIEILREAIHRSRSELIVMHEDGCEAATELLSYLNGARPIAHLGLTEISRRDRAAIR